MQSQQERMSAATALASHKTKGAQPIISAFLDSIHIAYNETTGEPVHVSVLTHYQSWFRYLDSGTFQDLSIGQIADLFITWIQNAVSSGLLSMEDPPMKTPIDPHAKLDELLQARRVELWQS